MIVFITREENLMEYPKIKNVFKFDEKYRSILGLNEPYESLKNIEWYGSEKCDGMNIRIAWDGHRISISGHTAKSVIPDHMMKYLSFLRSWSPWHWR